jgi:hypothetical protein
MYLTEVQTDVESRELAASNAPCIEEHKTTMEITVEEND